MLTTSLGRLRAIGWLEGSSYLLLLFVGMPLKYMAGLPQATEVLGMAHGLLFILYLLAAVHVWTDRDWPINRVGLAFIAAVLPFGPFVFDRRVLDRET